MNPDICDFLDAYQDQGSLRTWGVADYEGNAYRLTRFDGREVLLPAADVPSFLASLAIEHAATAHHLTEGADR